MKHAEGNRIVASTQGYQQVANASTSTLYAELLPSELGSTGWSESKNYEVTWILSNEVAAHWDLEQCLSSGLGSTAIRDRTSMWVAGVLQQVVTRRYTLHPGDRLRARQSTDASTGLLAAKIIAEPML